MSHKKNAKTANRETALDHCADQYIDIAKKNRLTVDELAKVLHRTRKAAVLKAKV